MQAVAQTIEYARRRQTDSWLLMPFVYKSVVYIVLTFRILMIWELVCSRAKRLKIRISATGKWMRRSLLPHKVTSDRNKELATNIQTHKPASGVQNQKLATWVRNFRRPLVFKITNWPLGCKVTNQPLGSTITIWTLGSKVPNWPLGCNISYRPLMLTN